ncbi:MAG: hypothetical protein M1825_004609 [Sarcosagium campestre]|nr:MAG: hypothetical protein M1825_004609 [Sarcosagium campestre]
MAAVFSGSTQFLEIPPTDDHMELSSDMEIRPDYAGEEDHDIDLDFAAEPAHDIDNDYDIEDVRSETADVTVAGYDAKDDLMQDDDVASYIMEDTSDHRDLVEDSHFEMTLQVGEEHQDGPRLDNKEIDGRDMAADLDDISNSVNIVDEFDSESRNFDALAANRIMTADDRLSPTEKGSRTGDLETDDYRLNVNVSTTETSENIQDAPNAFDGGSLNTVDDITSSERSNPGQQGENPQRSQTVSEPGSQHDPGFSVEQGAALSLVMLTYEGAEMSLFPNENDETFFLENTSLADASISDIFQAMRFVLADSIDEDDELEIGFEDLGLRLSESSRHADSTTLRQIVDVFVQLSQQDGTDELESFRMSLNAKPSFPQRFQKLSIAATNGQGLSQVQRWDDSQADGVGEKFADTRDQDTGVVHAHSEAPTEASTSADDTASRRSSSPRRQHEANARDATKQAFVVDDADKANSTYPIEDTAAVMPQDLPDEQRPETLGEGYANENPLASVLDEDDTHNSQGGTAMQDATNQDVINYEGGEASRGSSPTSSSTVKEYVTVLQNDTSLEEEEIFVGDGIYDDDSALNDRREAVEAEVSTDEIDQGAEAEEPPADWHPRESPGRSASINSLPFDDEFGVNPGESNPSDATQKSSIENDLSFRPEELEEVGDNVRDIREHGEENARDDTNSGEEAEQDADDNALDGDQYLSGHSNEDAFSSTHPPDENQGEFEALQEEEVDLPEANIEISYDDHDDNEISYDDGNEDSRVLSDQTASVKRPRAGSDASRSSDSSALSSKRARAT